MKIKQVLKEELAAEIKALATPGVKKITVHGPDGGLVREYIYSKGALKETNTNVPQANLIKYKITSQQMSAILARLNKMIEAGDFDGDANGYDVYIKFDGSKLDLTTKITKDPIARK